MLAMTVKVFFEEEEEEEEEWAAGGLSDNTAVEIEVEPQRLGLLPRA